MIRIRFWIWLDTVGLMVALSLTGCGSSQTTGTTTSVPPATTVAVNGATKPNSAPGMAHGAHGNMGANMSMATPPGGAGSGSSNDPSAMMKAHMGGTAMPPGGTGAPGSGANDPSAMMKAHMAGMASPPGGTPSPGSGVGDPSAMMKSHMAAGGMAKLPAGTAGNTDPSAMMKSHMGGMAKPPGVGGGSAPGGAAMAHGAAGAPGLGGTQGDGGPGMRGQGGNQGGNLSPGSVEDTILKFCTAMADGDTAAAAEFLSPKAKGLVGQLREGELSDEKVDEIKEAIAPVAELKPNPSQTSTKRSLRNRKNQVISFTMKKDKDDDTFKITEFAISKPKK